MIKMHLNSYNPIIKLGGAIFKLGLHMIFQGGSGSLINCIFACSEPPKRRQLISINTTRINT
jgi:hypothetical protein